LPNSIRRLSMSLRCAIFVCAAPLPSREIGRNAGRANSQNVTSARIRHANFGDFKLFARLRKSFSTPSMQTNLFSQFHHQTLTEGIVIARLGADYSFRTPHLSHATHVESKRQDQGRHDPGRQRRTQSLQRISPTDLSRLSTKTTHTRPAVPGTPRGD